MYSSDFEKFEPKAYIELSKKLYENLDDYKTSEALYSAVKRTIVDRLYYAGFLTFRNFIEEYYNYPPDTVKMEHAENLIEKGNFFKNWDNKKVYDYFYILRRNRAQCDFYFKNPNTENNLLGWSKKSIEDLFIITDHLIELIEKYKE